MMTAVKKNKGRPSKFDTINKEQVKKLAFKGFTDKEIADFFGVEESTLTRWKQKNEDFCTSLKDWKAVADVKVEKSLYDRACGYSHEAVKVFVIGGKTVEHKYVEHYPPSEVACIFWLKNRQPDKWRERVHNLNLVGTPDDQEFTENFFGFHRNGNGKYNGNGKAK